MVRAYQRWGILIDPRCLGYTSEAHMAAQKGPPKSPQAPGKGATTPKGGVGSRQSQGKPSSSPAGKQIGRPSPNTKAPKEV